jgi:hypothetical protein
VNPRLFSRNLHLSELGPIMYLLPFWLYFVSINFQQIGLLEVRSVRLIQLVTGVTGDYPQYQLCCSSDTQCIQFCLGLTEVNSKRKWTQLDLIGIWPQETLFCSANFRSVMSVKHYVFCERGCEVDSSHSQNFPSLSLPVQQPLF